MGSIPLVKNTNWWWYKAKNNLLTHILNTFIKVSNLNILEIGPGLGNNLHTLSKYGKVDVLINNASSFFATPLTEDNMSDWDDLINSNVKGPLALTKHLVENLKENSGAVINLSDAMVAKGMKNYSIYAVAKGGLESLTKSLAKELAPDIRVNAVAPGAILLPSDGSSDEEKLISSIPLGRIGNEKDISSAVFHLYKNKYITGQILRVDGGRSLN